MKSLLTGAAMIALLAPPVFAQSPSPQNQPGASTNSNSGSNSGPNMAAAQKIKQDLQSAGFTDVKVVAESFVVQAKSKDGDPVLMTIGPRGMSVFEARNNSKSDSSSTTGSSSNSMKPGSQNK